MDLSGYIILQRRVAMNGRLHSRHQMGVKVSDAIWTIICRKYFHVGQYRSLTHILHIKHNFVFELKSCFEVTISVQKLNCVLSV